MNGVLKEKIFMNNKVAEIFNAENVIIPGMLTPD